ncbi:MAG: MFS transporter [Cryobacterium sp.]|nr:MFS transporter [Cryobacterium sp.]
MWLRRAFSYLQFWAIAVLPLWVLIGRGVQLEGSGWGLLGLLLATPLLSLGLLVTLGLTVARRSVRRAKLVSRLDVAVLSVWYVSLVLLGLIAKPFTVILAIVVGLIVFWTMVWQLFNELRNRVSLSLGKFDAIKVKSTV